MKKGEYVWGIKATKNIQENQAFLIFVKVRLAWIRKIARIFRTVLLEDRKGMMKKADLGNNKWKRGM